MLYYLEEERTNTHTHTTKKLGECTKMYNFKMKCECEREKYG